MKYIIAAPPYSENSDGIRVLHLLCHTLNKLGLESFIVLIDPRDESYQSFISGLDLNATNPDYLTPTIQEFSQINTATDLIIYPEVIHNNPLNFKKIIRYFLNKEGNITGRKNDIKNTDFVICSQRIFKLDAQFELYCAPFINLNSIPTRNEILNYKKIINTTYIGKSNKYGECFRVKGSISLDWKKDIEEYHKLLQISRYLFIWDSMSGVVMDAVNFGTIPIVMSYKPWTEEEIKNTKLKLPFLLSSQLPDEENFPLIFNQFLDNRRNLLNNIIYERNNWTNYVVNFIKESKLFFNQYI